MSTETKPCPFCGSQSVAVQPGSTFRWVFAECMQCGASTGEERVQTSGSGTPAEWAADAEARAMAEWNRRTEVTTPPAASEAAPADDHPINRNIHAAVLEAQAFRDELDAQRSAALASREASPAPVKPVVEMLLELAAAAQFACDDSEECEGDDGEQVFSMPASAFNRLSEALDKLEALPDDQPGATMWPAAKARWALRDSAALASPQVAPIDMVLHCPKCHMQHIDEPDERTPGWKNEQHRSHLCHGCGHIWRPADVPTNGVAAVSTVGKADSPIAAPVQPGAAADDARDAEKALRAVCAWAKGSIRTNSRDIADWIDDMDEIVKRAERGLSTPAAKPADPAEEQGS